MSILILMCWTQTQFHVKQLATQAYQLWDQLEEVTNESNSGRKPSDSQESMISSGAQARQVSWLHRNRYLQCSSINVDQQQQHLWFCRSCSSKRCYYVLDPEYTIRWSLRLAELERLLGLSGLVFGHAAYVLFRITKGLMCMLNYTWNRRLDVFSILIK